MIDEEIDDAERNIAERQQLAQRCSQAEELEITNDAFYQYGYDVFLWLAFLRTSRAMLHAARTHSLILT